MSLCDLCSSIPFNSLPPTPCGGKDRTKPGGTRPDDRHMVQFCYAPSFCEEILPLEDDPEKNPVGFPYHENFAALEASATTCPLCALVDAGVKKWVKQYNEAAETNPTFREFTMQREPVPSEQRLWLTGRLGRPSSPPGFLVLARSADKGQGKGVGLHLLTAVGLSLPEEHPLSSQIPPRPLQSYSGSQQSLSVAASLLRECCESHEKCRTDDTSLPSRILDVKPVGGEDDQIRLIDGDGVIGKYACLSYCWGDSTPFTTSRETLEARRAGFSSSLLPKTLQDTVILVRSLGIRYLWIDCLCICQDDTEDWARESARMKDVYSKAQVVIAANHARDMSDGLFHERELQPAVSLSIPSPGQHDVQASLLIPMSEWSLSGQWADEASEPLMLRGWAFQERVLARRCLLFGSRHIAFECDHGIRSETGAVDAERLCRLRSSDDEAQPIGPFKPLSGTVHQQWYNMVRHYGRRELSNPTDMLPAMSGLAQLTQQLLGGEGGGEGGGVEYVAGLWSDAMIEGLAWQGIGQKKEPMGIQPSSSSSSSPPVDSDTRKTCYVAPSWSWASFAGIAAAGLMAGWHDVATVEEWHVALASRENPFGAVLEEGTWLGMRAPVARLTTKSNTATEQMREHEERLRRAGMAPLPRMRTVYSDGGADGNMVRFDHEELMLSGKWEGMELYALILGGYHRDEREGAEKGPFGGTGETYFALLVTPAGESPIDEGEVRMKRMGFLFVDYAEGGRMVEDKACWRNITLV